MFRRALAIARPGGAAVIAALLALGRPAAAEPPELVATIPPVHSLAAGVMAGIGEPALLIPGGRSPHDYALRPSDARALERADIVVRVGRSLETWLEGPLNALAAGATVVTLEDAPGVQRLPPRAGGVWQADGDHAHEHGGAPGAATIDGHIWLSTRNATAIVRAIAAALAARDPANAARYNANAGALADRIAALEAELRRTLAPVKDVPFVVLHDAFQYFDREFGLAAAGAIAAGPERMPGARRIAALRRAIEERGARCVFTGPQFASSLAGTVREGTGAREGVLDDLGAGLPPGPDQWFALMRGLGRSLQSCLAGG